MSAPDTLTLASLRTTEFAPGQLGVLGDPIAHSLSPAMHNAAIATLLPTNPRLPACATIACISPPRNFPKRWPYCTLQVSPA